MSDSVEKIYCTDPNCTSNSCDPTTMMALMGNGGINGQWNNPLKIKFI